MFTRSFAVRVARAVPVLALLTSSALSPQFAVAGRGSGPGKNVVPVISGSPPTTVLAGAPYEFVPTASDANGDRLKFSVSNRPAWATFDSTTGRLRGVPAASQTGSYPNVVISVSDGRARASLPAFTITVQASAATPPANGAPTISGTPAASVTAGRTYSFRPSASDPDGDRLTFSVANRPAWASFDASSGALVGTPSSADVGTYAGVAIGVSDGTLSASLPAFTIVVQAPNQPPTISGAPPASVIAGQTYTFSPRASDPEGRPLTFSITNKPTWATFSTATGALTGTPTDVAVGTYSNVSISVSDGALTAALAPFAITVQPAPLAGTAELYWQPPTTRTDGSALTTLGGYRIYYGTTRGAYPIRIDIPDPRTTAAMIERLAPATYYFVMTAYDTAGVESAYTAEVAKTVQ